MPVRPLERVAPSTFARLIACPLRVAFDRGDSGGQRASTPAARLGTAAHNVLAVVARGELSNDDVETFRASVESRWHHEVQTQWQAASSNPLESIFGEPEHWPGVNDVAARLLVEACRVRSEAEGWGDRKRVIEQELRPDGSPFYGSPDLILDASEAETGVVIDFKTGRSRDGDPHYRNQVLIYAHLADELGMEIHEAEVRYLAFPIERFAVTWDRVSGLVNTAREEVGLFNKAIESEDLRSLGRPSTDSCGFCPHATRCPAYWGARAVGDIPELAGARGEVVSIEAARGLMNLTIDDEIVSDRVLVARLPARRLPQLAGVGTGDLVSVVGLRADDANPRILISSPTSTWVRVAKGRELAYPDEGEVS